MEVARINHLQTTPNRRCLLVYPVHLVSRPDLETDPSIPQEIALIIRHICLERHQWHPHHQRVATIMVSLFSNPRNMKESIKNNASACWRKLRFTRLCLGTSPSIPPQRKNARHSDVKRKFERWSSPSTIQRYSTYIHHNSDGDLPHFKSAGSAGCPDVLSEDEEEELAGGQIIAPLWGKPRLDGNWGKYFPTNGILLLPFSIRCIPIIWILPDLLVCRVGIRNRYFYRNWHI